MLVLADVEPSGDHQMVSARLKEHETGIPNFYSYILGVNLNAKTEIILKEL